ncbi:MAG: hypothetical protein ACE5MG_05175 [Candidatus Methylomirabilales bacterium]
MSKKKWNMTILAFAVLGVLATSCSHFQPQKEDSQIQSLEKQLRAEKRKRARLQRKLTSERKKVKELTAQLEAVHPPLEGEALPVDELVAVPERYLGKDIIVEGKLGSPAFFRGPGGHFVLKSRASLASIQCYFRRKDLDPNSRRILAAKAPRQEMRILGRLLRASAGLSGQVGIRSQSGYEFHVTKIES